MMETDAAKKKIFIKFVKLEGQEHRDLYEIIIICL